MLLLPSTMDAKQYFFAHAAIRRMQGKPPDPRQLPQQKLLIILEQLTYPDYEIILVNDGSTDETAHIAKSFGVRVLTLANNVGAAAAAHLASAAPARAR